ncbi:hypothetical protein B0T20DRAFT_475388 [Sordaria brevicollis]|uniref:Uncharacterized protein n=1 Tax=Sordaria brevicollis TaxID=83679 RepID=A0AAE0PP68_SORBR|nr:hypothetical protein B0T20DRAFT_475388 [Sordaria brevicollis]
MAHRPKVNNDDTMDMDQTKPNDTISPSGAGDDFVVDLTSQPTTSQQPQKPNMRFDPSIFGSSSLASKLPSFLEELARANRETEQLMASNPKAARIEINSDDEDESSEEEGGGGRQVIEMNLYSGILEPENPDEKKGEKKEIVMPNGQPFAGDGKVDGGDEPFISEPVNVRHTNGTAVNDSKKRRASSSSSSSSASSSSSSSSSEGETRVIKLPISALQQRNSREASPADSQASDESAEHTGASSSRKEVTVPPRAPPKKKIVVARKADGSLSSSLKDQDVQDWVDSQPSTTGEYDEIEGAPKRKMLIPKTRVGSAESQKNVQDWVNKQANQEQGDHQ